jgi:hypothetical protein
MSREQEECQLTFSCIFKRKARAPSWVLGEEPASRWRVPTLPKPYSDGELSQLYELLAWREAHV